MKLRMLDYALLLLAFTKANADFRSDYWHFCEEMTAVFTMSNHDSNQAKHSKMQAQCSLKIASSLSSVFFYRTTSCFIFTHQLSQRSYLTCRIRQTSLLHLKNIIASFITSRHELFQEICRIDQKVSESMLWLSRRRLTLHLKIQRANQTMSTSAYRDLLRDLRRARRQLHWKRYENLCSTKMINSQSGLVSSCGNWRCTLYV